MPKNDLPRRAEDAVAKLKRSREQTLSPEVGGKRHKHSEDSGHSSNHHDSTHNSGHEKEPQSTDSTMHIPSDNRIAPTIDSSSVLADVAAFPRRTVGSVVYSPRKLICRGHELDFNCILQVRISHAYLSASESEALVNRRIWGTDVYTDDTDIVAALHHLDLIPKFDNKPSQDLLVEILLLPALKKYTGIKRNNLFSRSWLTPHDGISYMVLGTPKKMPRGWAHQGKDLMYERFIALRELRSWDPKSIVYI